MFCALQANVFPVPQFLIDSLACSPVQETTLTCDVVSFCFLTVPPAYYAHLAAFRARFYMEPEILDNQTSKTSNGTSGVSVKPLPAVKEKVKRMMFYC
jgi:hypothetical protein